MADLDNDGQPDLAVAHVLDGGGAEVSLLFPDGTGFYRTQRPPDNPQFTGDLLAIDIAAGDVDGDGASDLAAVTFEVDATGPTVRVVSRLHVLHGDGRGGFDGRRTLPAPHVLDTDGSVRAFNKLHRLTRGKYIAAGDVNGDGTADIVTSLGDSLAVALSEKGRGPRQSTSMDGSFYDELHLNKREMPEFVGIGDLDADGRADLVCLVGNDIAYTSIDFGDADGSPPALRDIVKVSPITMRISKLAVGDLDGDGFADDFVATDETNLIQGIGAGNGKFTVRPKDAVVKSRIDGLTVADIDGDGVGDILDVAISRKYPPRTGHVSILR